jgi:hypothetical protein
MSQYILCSDSPVPISPLLKRHLVSIEVTCEIENVSAYILDFLQDGTEAYDELLSL